METAAERFDLQIAPTPGWKRPILAVAAFAVGFGAMVAGLIMSMRWR